jgi:hypothetical protein
LKPHSDVACLRDANQLGTAAEAKLQPIDKLDERPFRRPGMQVHHQDGAWAQVRTACDEIQLARETFQLKTLLG